VTATPNHPGMTSHTATGRPGMTARIRTVGERPSDRIHAAADDRARARGWEVTQTPGPVRPERPQLPRPTIRRATAGPPGHTGQDGSTP
jgi:hypothetical protein